MGTPERLTSQDMWQWLLRTCGHLGHLGHLTTIGVIQYTPWLAVLRASKLQCYFLSACDCLVVHQGVVVHSVIVQKSGYVCTLDLL